MRWSLVALAVLVLAGCTAQIPDGRIGCHDPDRSCPAGYHCWDSTLTCHRMPEREGGTPDDASMADRDAFIAEDGGADGGAGIQYQPCGPREDCMPGTTCIAHQYCAPMCNAGACPPGPAPTGVCFGSYCLLDCTVPMGGAPEPCPGGSMCALGRWSGASSTGACVDTATVFPASHGIACGNDSECTAPEACVRGACMRPCPAMGPCGAGENCAPIPGQSERACMSACTTTCPTNFECVTPPGAPSATCFPTAWAVAGTRP